MHQILSVFALVLPEPSFGVLGCISAYVVSRLLGACAWQSCNTLKISSSVGVTYQTSAGPPTQRTAPLEKSVCCLQITTKHVTYAEKALMYVRAEGMIISFVSSLSAQLARMVWCVCVCWLTAETCTACSQSGEVSIPCRRRGEKRLVGCATPTVTCICTPASLSRTATEADDGWWIADGGW